MYGVDEVSVDTWMQAMELQRCDKGRLLEVLRFLKAYPAHFTSGRRGVEASRVRVCATLRALKDCALKSVQFSVPDVRVDFYKDAPLTVDGCHLPVRTRLHPFERRRYFSHKTPKVCCVTYQVVFDPWRQKAMHVFGPCPASVGDKTLWALSKVADLMPPGKSVLGDAGYVGCRGVLHPLNPGTDFDVPNVRHHNRRIRAVRWQVEAFFSRVKAFKAMSTPWRHDLSLHACAFALLTSLLNFHLRLHPLDDGH